MMFGRMSMMMMETDSQRCVGQWLFSETRHGSDHASWMDGFDAVGAAAGAAARSKSKPPSDPSLEVDYLRDDSREQPAAAAPARPKAAGFGPNATGLGYPDVLAGPRGRLVGSAPARPRP